MKGEKTEKIGEFGEGRKGKREEKREEKEREKERKEKERDCLIKVCTIIIRNLPKRIHQIARIQSRLFKLS